MILDLNAIKPRYIIQGRIHGKRITAIKKMFEAFSNSKDVRKKWLLEYKNFIATLKF